MEQRTSKGSCPNPNREKIEICYANAKRYVYARSLAYAKRYATSYVIPSNNI